MRRIVGIERWRAGGTRPTAQSLTPILLGGVDNPSEGRRAA